MHIPGLIKLVKKLKENKNLILIEAFYFPYACPCPGYFSSRNSSPKLG
jgi:hypothetical protein